MARAQPVIDSDRQANPRTERAFRLAVDRRVPLSPRPHTHVHAPGNSMPGGAPVVYGEDDDVSVQSNFVSANYFDMLGVGMRIGSGVPARGRGLHVAARVAIISERLWREHFGALSSIIGETLLVYDSPFTIVGVAQAGFFDVETHSAGSLRCHAHSLALGLRRPEPEPESAGGPAAGSACRSRPPRARCLESGRQGRARRVERPVSAHDSDERARVHAAEHTPHHQRPSRAVQPAGDFSGGHRRARIGHAARVRQRRQPDSRAWLVASARVRHPAVARRQPHAGRASAGHRGPAPVRAGRRRRSRGRDILRCGSSSQTTLPQSVAGEPRSICRRPWPCSRFTIAMVAHCLRGLERPAGTAINPRRASPRARQRTAPGRTGAGRLRTTLLAAQLALSMVLLVGAGLLTRPSVTR